MKVLELDNGTGFYATESCSTVDFLIAIAKQYGSLEERFDKESLDTNLVNLLGYDYIQSAKQVKRKYWNRQLVDQGIPFPVSALDPSAVTVTVVLKNIESDQ
jgi:hypothetical protein